MSTLLSSCSNSDVIHVEKNGNIISIPLSIMQESKTQIIRVAGYQNEIALASARDGEITAIVMQCTHVSNPLTFTGTGYICPVHGSKFGIEGDVLHGPAQRPLRRLPTRISNNTIVIRLNSD